MDTDAKDSNTNQLLELLVEKCALPYMYYVLTKIG